MSIGIYKIENKINHHKYIGQSKNIEKRWAREKTTPFNPNDHSYDYPLSRAIRKYGLENFDFSIIEECSIQDLNTKEKYWIEYYNSFFDGYNQTIGGDASIGQPKEVIISVFYDLENTDLTHSQIAEKNGVSIETVQGINSGRYWKMDNKTYPLQERCRILQEKRGQGRTKRYCPNCGAEISQKAKLCVSCANLASRKVERPDRETLKQLIRITPFTQIGKKYGVTDSSIRKWCKAYNLPSKSSEIQRISQFDWKNI